MLKTAGISLMSRSEHPVFNNSSKFDENLPEEREDHEVFVSQSRPMGDKYGH